MYPYPCFLPCVETFLVIYGGYYYYTNFGNKNVPPF